MYDDDYLTTRYGYVYGQASGMTREEMKAALAEVDSFFHRWMEKWATRDTTLQPVADHLHAATVAIDHIREDL